jgi:glyoxylase-like metal-dependent hydrolase (beta-lactamase superfamily II)
MKPWIAIALCAASCMNGRSKTSSDAMDRVDRGLAAMGGADKVSALQAVAVKGTARHWEPEQSVKADGEMRLAGDSIFVLTRDLANDAARIEWDRNFVYPSPREYKFTEVVTKSAGYVDGIDSTGRTKRDLESNPARHAMSGQRLAAAQRELRRSSPRLLAEMKAHPGDLEADEISIGDKRMPAVRYQAGDTRFFVAFDGSTGLPARIRTIDADNIHGDSSYDLVLSDYRDVSGVKIAHTQGYELNGREVIHIQYQEARAGAAAPPGGFEVPADLQAPPPARGNVPYQWVIRRQFIGTYLDTDAMTHDPQGAGLKLTELAPGVLQVAGGSHNSFIVEMADHLVVFDAPIGEAQSRFTLDALKAKYPSKPVKLLVLTHHHMDHTGGARTFVAQGASVLVGKGNGPHFDKVFAAPHKVDGDSLDKAPRKPDIEEIADRKVLDDGQRKIEILRVDNPHADGLLIAYVPDAKIGFVVDIWSPGRDKLGDKATPGQQALVAAVAKLSSTPERFAGGHGTVADYAPLASLAGAQPRAER